MKPFQSVLAILRSRRFTSPTLTPVGSFCAALLILAVCFIAGAPFALANDYQVTPSQTTMGTGAPTMSTSEVRTATKQVINDARTATKLVLDVTATWKAENYTLEPEPLTCAPTSEPSATSRGKEFSFTTPDFTNTPTITPVPCYSPTPDETATRAAINATGTWRAKNYTPPVRTRAPVTSVPQPTNRRPPTTNPIPAGATAICNDGTYSFTQHRSGACSHHGGVRQWLVNLPP